jgi:hypothetical protein
MTYDELVAAYGDDLLELALLYGGGNYWQGIIWLESEPVAETINANGVLTASYAAQTAALVEAPTQGALTASYAAETVALVGTAFTGAGRFRASGILHTGAVVTSWPDAAGVYTMAANGSPVYVANALNGHPGVQCVAASSQWLGGAAGAITADYTLACVGQLTGASGYRFLFGGVSAMLGIDAGGNYMDLHAAVAVMISNVVADANFHRFVVTRTAAGAKLWIDETPATLTPSDSALIPAWAWAALGCSDHTGTNPTDCIVVDAYHSNVALSDANALALSAVLKADYGM